MTLRYAHHALESTTPAMRALDELSGKHRVLQKCYVR